MRKFFALLLIVLLVAPLLFTALTVIAVNVWALDRNFYLQLVGDEAVYEAALAEEGSIHIDDGVLFEGQRLPAGLVSRALREVLTARYLSDQATRLVDDTFDFVDGRDYTLDLSVDLVPIKTALAGEAGPRVAQVLAEGLPACAAGETPLAAGASLPHCRPAELSTADLSQQIALALPAHAATLPDRAPLGDGAIDLRAEMGHDGLWLWFLPSIRGVAIFSIVILAFLAVGLWLIAGFLAGYDERERLQWLGWSLLVPAVAVFLIGLLISGSFALGWVRFGLEQAEFSGLSNALAWRQALLELSRVALRAVSNGFMAAGGVPAAVAIGLIVWGGSTPAEPRPAGDAQKAQ